METISKFATSIYGIGTAVVFAIVLLWQCFLYIHNANIAHDKINKFENVHELVIDLSEQVENLRIQVSALKDLSQHQNEVREFDSLKLRFDTLQTWEKARYCELFKKLMAGGICSA